MMKYISIIVFVFLACNSDRPKVILAPLQVELKLIREYDVPFPGKPAAEIGDDTIKERRYDIEVSLKNNADRSMYLWLMTCSWEENFLRSNPFLKRTGKDCDHNFPSNKELKPGEIRRYKTTLASIAASHPACSYCFWNNRFITTKLGLILISDIYKSDFVDYHLYINDSSKWEGIVWSNPIYLLK